MTPSVYHAMHHVSVDHPDALSKAVSVLRAGGVVVAPTETSYGVLADARRPGAVVRVVTLKDRELHKPTSVFLPDVASVARYAVLPLRAKRIAERFLPGPLTLVLPVIRAEGFAPGIVSAKGEIGIRVSSHPFTQALTAAYGGPLTATSANKAGEPACYALADLPQDLAQGADILLDGGVLPEGHISTIVRVFGENEEVEVLREGVIPTGDILAV